jgi:hypothetical protein
MPFKDPEERRRAKRESERRRRARERLRRGPRVHAKNGVHVDPDPPALRTLDDVLMALEAAAAIVLESDADAVSVSRALVAAAVAAGRLLAGHETEQRLLAIERHLGIR